MNEYDDLIDGGNSQAPKAQGSGNEYDSYLDEDQQSVTSQLKQSLYVAGKKDPDRHAKVLEAAKDVGLPSDVVDRQFEKVSQVRKERQVNYDRLAKESPNIAKFLAENPDHATVAQDDLGNLERIEREAKGLSTLGRWGSSLVSGLNRAASSAAKAPALAYNAWYLPANFLRKARGQEQIRAPEQLVNNQLTRLYDTGAESAAEFNPSISQDVLAKVKEKDVIGAADAAVSQFLLSAPQMAAGMAAYIYSGGTAGALTMGGLSASQKNAENMQDPNVEPIQGTGNALAYGSIEAAFEKLGTFKLLDRWEGAIAKSVGEGTAKEFSQAFLKTMASSVLGEANEEAMTSLAQDYLDYQSGVNANALQGAGERAISAGLVGAVGGGLMTGPVATASGLAKAQQIRQAKVDQQFLDKLNTTVQESKTQKRSPEVTKAAIDAALQGTEALNVHIPVEAAEAYFQSKSVPVSQVMSEAGALESYNEAKVTGGDIVVPVSTWVTKFGSTEYYQGLKNDVRIRPDSMTQGEIAKAQEEEQAAMEQAANQPAPMEQEQDVAAQIKADIMQRMSGVVDGLSERGTPIKLDDKQMDAIAEIQTRNYLTQALQLGENPMDFYQREAFSFGRMDQGAQEGAQAYNQQRLILTPKDNGDGSLTIGEPGMQVNLRIDPNTNRAFLSGFDTQEPGNIDRLLDSGEKWSVGTERGFVEVRADEASANPTLKQKLEERGWQLTQNGSGDLVYAKDLSTFDPNLADGLRAQYNSFDEQAKARSLLNGSLAPDSRRGTEGARGKQGKSRGRMDGLPKSSPGAIEGIRSAFQIYQKENGLTRTRPERFVKIPDNYQKAFADAYSKAKHSPTSPEVKAAYSALIKETEQQYKLIEDMGLKIERSDAQPYADYDSALIDVFKNGHLYVTGDTYEAGHPMLLNTNREIDGLPLTAGEMFKIVHTVFGHAQEGYEFDRHGRDNAWQMHRFMYSPLAQKALFSEARAHHAAGFFSGKLAEPKKAVILKDSIRAFGNAKPVTVYNQENASDVKGRILISPLERMIQISPNADVSTFLHEGAHGWLDMYAKNYGELKGRDEATLTEGQKSYIKLGDDILKVLGVESFDSIGVDQHETFARMAEAYFMEGKAPTQGLQKVFTRFKLWLTEIYRYIKGLNVQMTDDVRSMFDRMIATEEELAITEQQQNIVPLFGANPESFGLTGRTAERYMEATQNAKDEARKRLLTKFMEQIKLQRQDFYKEQYKANYGRYEADANQMPVYRAIEVLTKGKLPGDDNLDEVPFKIKLSKEILDQAFDKDIVKLLPRSIYMREKPNGDAGVHPDVAAEMLGFGSGADLVYQIAQSIPKKEWIKNQTDAYMKQAYPDLLDNQDAIEREATAALRNESRAKLLRMELEILATENLPALKDVIRKVVRRVPPESEVRQQAETMIAKKLVSEVKPHVFLRAEYKARKEAGDFLTRGDLDKAFEAKRRELLNHELYRAAEDAIERRDKALERFKKFRQPDEKLAKSRDMDLVNAGRAILSRVGLALTDKDPATYIEAIRRYDPESYETVNSILNATTGVITNYKQMKQGDFDQLVETVRALWDLAKSNKQIEIDGQMFNRDEIQVELQGRLLELTKPQEMAKLERAADTWDKVKMNLLSVRAAATRVESWVIAMDGSEKAGPFRKYIWNPISDAINTYRIAKVDVLKRYLNKSLKPIEKSLTAKPIQAKELRYEFKDKAELLGALLHVGNESNYKKLLLGRGWGQLEDDGTLDDSRFKRFIDRAMQDGTLTKADFDYVQSVWNLLEELKPMAQKAHKKMYGHYFNEITAKPIETPFGSYRGGYFPAVADPFLNTDAAAREERDIIENNDNSFMFPTTGRGFTKAREEAYTPKLSMDLRLVPQHIDKVLRFAHIEPQVKAVGRLIVDRSFRASLDAVDQTAGNDMLVPWLQRAAQQSTAVPSKTRAGKAMDSVAKAMRSRAGLQAMVLNVVNTVQQFTGYSLAGVKVKPRHLRKGILTYIKSPAQVGEDVASKSEYMRTRLTGEAQEITRAIDDLVLNPNKFERLRDFSVRHGYVLQAGLQNAMDATVWIGAYNQAIEEGLKEKDAVRFADSTIRTTQGSINPEDISRIEGGTAFHRLFTQFYSYFNMQANLLGSEFAVIQREIGLKKGAGKLFYLYLIGFMAPAVVAELVVRAGAGKLDDDDDEEYIDDYLNIFFGSQFRLATAMFPAVGPAINSGVNRFNSKQYDDRIQTSPAISAIESTVAAPKSIYQAIANDGRKKTAIRDTLTAISMLTGVPVAPLGKPLGYLSDVAEGNADPTGPVDFTRGLITGRPGPQ
jgi:hypothetical protein